MSEPPERQTMRNLKKKDTLYDHWELKLLKSQHNQRQTTKDATTSKQTPNTQQLARERGTD